MMVTLEEVARVFGVSRKTIQRKLKTKKLPLPVVQARKYLWPRSTLERVIREKTNRQLERLK